MLAKTLKSGLGNWVDGERFFDREREMALFREYLQSRTSLLLVAPRRIGKTSFMREAARRLGGDIIALHVDLQKAMSPEEAIVELGLACRPHASLWTKAVGAFGDVLSKIENVKLSELSVTLRSALTSANWRQKGDELIAQLSSVAEQSKKPAIIFFDEVPILINRVLKGTGGDNLDERKLVADSFMSWMRDNALRHKDNVVFVVTGSIGLEPVLRAAGLSGTLNAFHAFELPPWKVDVAEACLLALAAEKKLPLPSPVAAHMINLLGCAIPHHVQMFFDHVYSAYFLDDKEGDVPISLVDAVYNGRMTGLRGHAELMHMEERLKMVLTEEQFDLALTLLTETAVVGVLAPAASLAITKSFGGKRNDLLETLSILQHDGYIQHQGENFVFVSNLVRDWWKNRFGHGYAPAKC